MDQLSGGRSISLDKTKLNTVSTHYRLYTEIKNLSFQVQREKKLMEIADTKIKLAMSVLEDERENYSLGKVTLNDYIAAVNVLDTNRFNKVLHNVQNKKLNLEWLRLTDRLVDKNKIKEMHSKKN